MMIWIKEEPQEDDEKIRLPIYTTFSDEDPIAKFLDASVKLTIIEAEEA